MVQIHPAQLINYYGGDLMDKVLKPLKPAERIFVRNIVINGLSPLEAYSEENEKSIQSKAKRCLNKENVNSLYQAMMEEVRDNEVKKAVWTKEVATEKLMRLIEKAEWDIYEDDKPITMARLSAILQPAKELNVISGLTQTNLNITSHEVVQFVGEDDIPD